jgi:hypothetical protein
MDDFEYLMDKIDLEIDGISGPLLAGSCDLEEYRILTGRIAGLRWVKEEIRELRNRRINDED